MRELRAEIRQDLTREIVTDIIGSLSERFLGAKPASSTNLPPLCLVSSDAPIFSPSPLAGEGRGEGGLDTSSSKPTAASRIAAITTVPIRKEAAEFPIHTVTLGGGARPALTIGGDTSMPFHLWEGAMPNRPLVAMEVFDCVSPKYPPVLREIWGDLLSDPAAMAKACCVEYGADLISVRLEGTHPEKGGRTPAQALEVVKSVLTAVSVPIIVTGTSHFESNNEVMKEVARGCEGENLLLNWVEQDNYRTIAGAALAYGHSVVAQSPIDVNIAKQLVILLTSMNIPVERIVIDPVTSALGYGIEYTYSVMERIRQSGLGGDSMLACPLIVSPGQECAKIKELRAPVSEFPAWGELSKRAALWEYSTAATLLNAGAGILIMYNPEAVMALKKTITDLKDGRN